MAEDKVILTADASNYFDVMRRAGDEAEKFGQRINKASNGSDLLESTRRVRRNIRELAEEFATGSSSTDLFKSSISRLSEVFRIGLPTGLLVGVGTALYEGIRKAYDETVQLQQATTALTSDQGRGEFRQRAAIESHLEALEKQRQAVLSIGEAESHVAGVAGLGAARALASVTGTAASALGPFAVAAAAGFGAGRQLQEERLDQERQLAAIRESERADVQAAADQESHLTEAGRQRLSGSTEEADKQEIILASLLKQADAFEKFNKPGAYKELSSLLDQIGEETTNQLRQNVEQHDLERQRLGDASAVADIEKRLLPQADERLAVLQQEISFRQRLLDTDENITQEKRKQIETEIKQLDAVRTRVEFETNFQRDLATARVTAGTQALGLKLGGQPRQAELLQFQTGLQNQIKQAIHDFGEGAPQVEKLRQQLQLGTQGRQEAGYFEFRRNPAAVIQQQLGAEEAQRQFERARADYFDRKARGAYGQSQFERQLYETPETGTPTAGTDLGSYQYQKTKEAEALGGRAAGLLDTGETAAGLGAASIQAVQDANAGGAGGIGGSQNDIASNVKHIRELLDKTLAVK